MDVKAAVRERLDGVRAEIAARLRAAAGG